MNEPIRSSTTTLIEAMQILSREIQSGDGVANAAIAEAAERLEELQGKLETCKALFDFEKKCVSILITGKDVKAHNILYKAAKEACE